MRGEGGDLAIAPHGHGGPVTEQDREPRCRRRRRDAEDGQRGRGGAHATATAFGAARGPGWHGVGCAVASLWW
jgi:hypothetical protein